MISVRVPRSAFAMKLPLAVVISRAQRPLTVGSYELNGLKTKQNGRQHRTLSGSSSPAHAGWALHALGARQATVRFGRLVLFERSKNGQFMLFFLSNFSGRPSVNVC